MASCITVEYDNWAKIWPGTTPASTGCAFVAQTPGEYQNMLATIQSLQLAVDALQDSGGPGGAAYPSLTQADIAALASAVALLWATAWAWRFIRRLIPKN